MSPFFSKVRLYLQSDFVELSEREDGLLHHVHALVLQQHVEVGNQAQQQLVVPLAVTSTSLFNHRATQGATTRSQGRGLTRPPR